MNTARHRHLAAFRACQESPMQPNQVLYFVISSSGSGRYVPERDIADMTREATLRDLRSGELCDVVSIIETEIGTEISSRDVTKSMLAEADFERTIDTIADVMEDRQAARFDHSHDHRKNYQEG